MMSPMPAIVVRAAVPQDFDAIVGLVAGMFQDLGTTVFPDAWRDDLQQALVSRLWNDAAAFVAVDRADVPIAVAVGIGAQDHVHLLVQYPPKVALSHLANSLNAISSRRLRQDPARTINKRSGES